MKQLIQWWAMGGYAIYIWSAYGLTWVMLLMFVVEIRIQRSRAHQKLRQWFKRCQNEPCS